MNWKTICVLLGFASTCAALFSAGCQPGGPKERTYPVTGVVTLNNEPVADAAVTFHPAGSGKLAVGKTDASGRFTLTTTETGQSGAVPGRYRVTVAKYVSPEQPAAVAPSGEYQEQAPETTPAPAQNVLPAKYADPSTSGFEVEVKAGENSFTFALQQ
jgi:hypothetical protein